MRQISKILTKIYRTLPNQGTLLVYIYEEIAECILIKNPGTRLAFTRQGKVVLRTFSS
jgi:hypothetical protein